MRDLRIDPRLIKKSKYLEMNFGFSKALLTLLCSGTKEMENLDVDTSIQDVVHFY